MAKLRTGPDSENPTNENLESSVDCDDNELRTGDRVEIAHMDDPTLQMFLNGKRGKVHALPPHDEGEPLINVEFDEPIGAMAGIATFSRWVRKLDTKKSSKGD